MALRGPVHGCDPNLHPYEARLHANVQGPLPHPEVLPAHLPLASHSLAGTPHSGESGSLHNMIHGTLPFPAYSPPSPHTHPCWPCLVPRPTPSRRGCQPAAPGPAGLEMQPTWLPHLPNEIWFHFKSQSCHKKKLQSEDQAFAIETFLQNTKTLELGN